MKKLLLISFSALLFSCSEPEKENEPVTKEAEVVDSELKSLQDEMLAVHDSIMPEITTVRSLKKTIKDSTVTGDTLIVFEDLAKRLQQADDDMMDWMHMHHETKYVHSKEKNLELARDLLSRIKRVKKDMEEVIMEGRNLLGE